MADLSALSVPTAMTIAGSDSGGGAGIQADLKTFAALGVYGTSVLTALTAQNTQQVNAVHEVPLRMISSQIRTVMADIGADVVKTGMLSSSAIVEMVARELGRLGVSMLVVDPVMVAKSGDQLLKADAVEALRTHLLPMATVVTPNIPEAEVLSGIKITGSEEARRAAEVIRQMGPQVVVVKGGHLSGPAVDVYCDRFGLQEFIAPRIQTKNTHGTGCTFASAIAAYMALGFDTADAVAKAKEYVTQAMSEAYDVGHGHGPVNHFYMLKG